MNKRHAEIVRVMQAPDIQQRLLTEGAKFTPLSPEQFGGFIKSEIAKWAKVIQQSGIRVD